MAPPRETLKYRPSFEPNRVRLSALFFPAEEVTWEEFSEYWMNEHGKLFASLDIVKKNLTKYEQFHINPKVSQNFATEMGTERTPFWGMATFEAETYDRIIEVFAHPDYLRVIFPDERHILDRSKSQVLAGDYASMISS